jgi:predicted DNA binding CopG/RHH family protein
VIKVKKYKLDREEKEILDALENGKWETVKPNKIKLSHYARVARNTFKKDQRMNIRISKADLDRIKARDTQEGIPYQTLVASIIHKYATGNLLAA